MTFDQIMGFLDVVLGAVIALSGVGLNHFLANRRRKAEKRERVSSLRGELEAISSKLSDVVDIHESLVTGEIDANEFDIAWGKSLAESFQTDGGDEAEEDLDYLIGSLQTYIADMKDLTEKYFSQILAIYARQRQKTTDTGGIKD